MARHHDRSSELLAASSNSTPGSKAAAADVDVPSDVLQTVNLTGALFFPLAVSSPWADEIPAAGVLAPAVLPGAQHVVSYRIV